MQIRQVLLAPNKILTPEEHERLGHFPMLASIKLDGNRLFVHRGRLLTRSMKEQPNTNLRHHLQALIGHSVVCGLSYDGELYSPQLEFNELQSIIRSQSAPIPDHVQFWLFDVLADDKDTAFGDRQRYLQGVMEKNFFNRVQHLPQYVVNNAAEVNALYEKALEMGCEGLILRDPRGRYKDNSRATLNDRIIFKLKPFETADAVVIGYEEQQSIRSDIDRTRNEVGRLARTSRREHLIGAGTMGALRVCDEHGREFNLGWGPGWTHQKRLDLWLNRNHLHGEWVEYRYIPIGEKDNPRQPQLLRFREPK